MTVFPEPPQSLWQHLSGPDQPEPSLFGEQIVDVAIIGGGFAGLMTAYEIKRAEPSLDVALVEAKTVGYGSSGRNGSFAMTVIGLGFGTNAMLRGKQWLKDSHAYMEQAVDTLDELILRESLDCDRLRPGFLRVATTRGYIKRLQHDIELMHNLGFTGIDWMDAEAVHQRVNSARYLGALWEPRLVLVNPLKLVREEKRMAIEAGVRVYENTPVLEIVKQPGFSLSTPNGILRAEKIAFTTNAYSHLFPALGRKQIPAFTYMVATEPLNAEQLEPIGWQGCEGIEDARNLIHYYRITPDRRLVMGGGPVGLTLANNLNKDNSESSWKQLEDHIHFLFPSLRDVCITHRWGGPFSVTLDLAPALGYVGDERAVYSLGCIGHGVSMSHLNAQVLRDLLLERRSQLTDSPFVNRRVIPWPPEPFRFGAAFALRGYLQLEDALYERELPHPH